MGILFLVHNLNDPGSIFPVSMKFLDLKKGVTRHISNFLNLQVSQTEMQKRTSYGSLISVLAAFLFSNSSSAPRLHSYIYHQIFSLCDQWGDLFWLLTLLLFFNKSRDMQKWSGVLNAHILFSFPQYKASKPDIKKKHITLSYMHVLRCTALQRSLYLSSSDCSSAVNACDHPLYWRSASDSYKAVVLFL